MEIPQWKLNGGCHVGDPPEKHGQIDRQLDGRRGARDQARVSDRRQLARIPRLEDVLLGMRPLQDRKHQRDYAHGRKPAGPQVRPGESGKREPVMRPDRAEARTQQRHQPPQKHRHQQNQRHHHRHKAVDGEQQRPDQRLLRQIPVRHQNRRPALAQEFLHLAFGQRVGRAPATAPRSRSGCLQTARRSCRPAACAAARSGRPADNG